MTPTYRALAELGKAAKTVFLTRFLRSEALRREIHEGLNTIESWNAANAFVFYGKGGKIATNRLEEQEISVLALHLLQMALVYVNTLMIQQVLKEPAWQGRLTAEDRRGRTPLIFAHVNPYGTFELHMDERLSLDDEAAPRARRRPVAPTHRKDLASGPKHASHECKGILSSMLTTPL